MLLWMPSFNIGSIMLISTTSAPPLFDHNGFKLAPYWGITSGIPSNGATSGGLSGTINGDHSTAILCTSLKASGVTAGISHRITVLAIIFGQGQTSDRTTLLEPHRQSV
jgi:hypothetical protein